MGVFTGVAVYNLVYTDGNVVAYDAAPQRYLVGAGYYVDEADSISVAVDNSESLTELTASISAWLSE